MVAEGGNLGFTQLGRVEYAQHGGRNCTDAIDNSAGVDCSAAQVADLRIGIGRLAQVGAGLRIESRSSPLALGNAHKLRDLRIDQRGTRLSDVADIDLKPQRMDYVRRMDGKPSVGVDIYKERSANLVDLSLSVRAEIAELEKDPAMRGVNIEVTDDQGQAVTSSLLALAEAGGIGCAELHPRVKPTAAHKPHPDGEARPGDGDSTRGSGGGGAGCIEGRVGSGAGGVSSAVGSAA